MQATAFYRLLVVSIAALIAVAPSTSAFAAPPPNDDLANAIVMTALPFTDTQDTTEATAAADDPTVCPNTGSVWYTFTPSTDMRIIATTSGSNYNTLLSVYAGSPGNFSFVTCDDDSGGSGTSRVVFDAAAGTPYYFLIAVCCGFGGSGGGSLVFSVNEVEPLVLELTVNEQASRDKRTGAVTVSGTLTCTVETDSLGLNVEVRQPVGRTETVRGSAGTGLTCTPGTPTNWSVTLLPESGKFAGGRATAIVSASGCAEFSCDDVQVLTAVRLR